MKFLLAIALLIPAMAQAAPGAQKIQGEDALRLWSALSGSESDFRKIQTASVSIECRRSQSECAVSLSHQDGGKDTYLYRDDEAQQLYGSLKLEEFEGRLGFTKIFAGIDSEFEILCSRFFGSEGETFSCSIDLG